MTLKLVGAGLGRTGTASLKMALEQLLGEPCYHMREAFVRPSDIATFERALDGEHVDWVAFFNGWGATVDWPTVTFWEDIAAAFPDAPILLSVRDSADQWWTSADSTILRVFDTPPQEVDPWRRMATSMLERFARDFRDADDMKAAYEAHNAYVRATAPAERLVEWNPRDGWGPICDALGVPVPDEPFPHTNTTKEFREMAGWD